MNICDWCGKESEVLYTCESCGDENCPKCHIDIAGTCWDCATGEGDDDWLKDEGVSKPPRKKEAVFIGTEVCKGCNEEVESDLMRRGICPKCLWTNKDNLYKIH